MKDPTRLLEQGATSVELDLLRAGASEEPSRGSVQRAAAALGIAATVGASAPGAAAASTAGQVGFWTAAKFVGAGLLVASAVSVAAVKLSPSAATWPVGQPPSQASSPAPAAPGEPAQVVAAPGAADQSQPGAAEPGDEAAVEPPAHIAPSRRSVAGPSRGSASIREQTAIIDAARRQLGAGDPAGALQQLERYQVKFPRGMLGQEATLLRVEALVQSGNRAAARRLARQLLTRHPDSQYANRLEALVGPVSSNQPE
jgi:hypothetical protein